MALKLNKYTNIKKAVNEENIDVFYTSDMKDELELFEKMNLDVFSREIARRFSKFNSNYKKIINDHAKKNNLENIAILAAHTKKIKGNWFYFNEDAGSPIQEWIDKVDVKYGCLIIYLCNSEKDELFSEKSPLFILSRKERETLV